MNNQHNQPLTGTVKWYSKKQGYGFISPDSGNEEIFLHHSALPGNNDANINVGDRIAFSVEQGTKGLAATNVTRLDPQSPRQGAKIDLSPGKASSQKATARSEQSPMQKKEQTISGQKKNAESNKKTGQKVTVRVQEQVQRSESNPKRSKESQPVQPSLKKGSESSKKAEVQVRVPDEKQVQHNEIKPTQSKKNQPKTDVDPNITCFRDFGLNDNLQRAVQDAGYVTPTPIQAKAIPLVLAGRDLFGCAQTGTGKTAAFALPILHNLARQASTAPRSNEKGKKSPNRETRVLVLAPTRELAIQTAEFFTQYGRYTGLINTVIYGGVGQNPQVEALQRGVDILVATPGRLLDLQEQGFVHLEHVEVLVLDEGDRMLDMGFIHDVRRIISSVPPRRQTLLFSATIPREVIELASSMLHDPANISVTPDQPTVEAIKQFVYFVPKKKKQLLLTHLLKDKAITRVLVFTRTKHGANKVVKLLSRDGITADPIHGNKSQTARQKALENFRQGTTRVLVATDVASRGIDVEEISHVIQFDLPTEPETYVHRIGRTGRAGLAGIAFAFCDDDERQSLKDIERLIHQRVPVIEDHPYKD